MRLSDRLFWLLYAGLLLLALGQFLNIFLFDIGIGLLIVSMGAIKIWQDTFRQDFEQESRDIRNRLDYIKQWLADSKSAVDALRARHESRFLRQEQRQIRHEQALREQRAALRKELAAAVAQRASIARQLAASRQADRRLESSQDALAAKMETQYRALVRKTVDVENRLTTLSKAFLKAYKQQAG